VKKIWRECAFVLISVKMNAAQQSGNVVCIASCEGSEQGKEMENAAISL